MMKSLGPLHGATMDLHHAVERTPVGAAMAAGKPPRLWYAGWLKMKGAIHARIDRGLAPVSRRADAYAADLVALGLDVPIPSAVMAHVAWLDDAEAAERERRFTGTAYVMVGGALMGGEVIRRRLGPDLPAASFGSACRQTEMAILLQYRQRGDCADQARACFQALIDACAEIEGWA